jgi:hypothetical protein
MSFEETGKMSFEETGKVKELKWRVEKFKAKNSEEIKRKNLKPYEVIETKHHCLLNEGIQELIDLIQGTGSPQSWDNTHAYIGVGDDNTAPVASQSGLLGSNKKYKGMNAGYPQYEATNKSVWQADFVDTEAEWHWQEETISNSNSDSGKNLCRQNTDLGTKPSGQTWRLTATITWS